jgi:uncharacterized damage-inducible protein DinB
MQIRELLLPEFEQEMVNTRKLLALVPEDKLDFKPHPKSMELGRLAAHTAELADWAKVTLTVDVLELDASMKPYTATTTAELLSTFDKNVDAARAELEKATDEEMGKTWTMKFEGKAMVSLPRYMVLRNMVFNHLVHHRAQLGVYLRLNEIAIPGMYGASADEPKFWQTAAAT